MNYSIEKSKCIFCNQQEVQRWFTKNGRDGSYQIVRCPSCLSSYVWPRPSKEEIDRIYSSEEYALLEEIDIDQIDSRYYPTSKCDAKKMISRLKTIMPQGKFLDVGAGYGTFSYEASCQGYSVSACEPSPSSRKVFSLMNGYEPEDSLFDRNYASQHKQSFNCVLLSQVLEHLINPDDVVDNIAHVLDKNGIAVIALPHFRSFLSLLQGEGDMFISPPQHLNYVTPKGLEALFARHGFKMVHYYTSSKVNKESFVRLVKSKGLSAAMAYFLYGILYLSDLLGKGMVINAYFRKQ